MPLVADRVKESTTTTGTGTLTLLGAATGFTTFVAGVGSGVTVYYTIAGPSEWEVGVGTTGAGTLTRTTVLSSSNGGSLVNFSAGTKDVFCTYPAGKAVMTDDAATLANKTLTAPTITGTTTLNTVPYTFPSAQGAASTLLTNNGSGTLTWTASTLPTATRTRTAFTATASQTTFTVNYTVNQVDVFLNGVLLAAGDYTASNGTTVVLATGATSGDEVSVVTYTGTIGAPDANSLTGTTLASGVTASSLTSVGTLAGLTVTAPIAGSVTGSSASTTGNAATATALQTARTINGTSFDGTANVTVTAAASTLTGATLASGVTASSLTSVGTLTALTTSGTTSLATTAGAVSVRSVAYTFPSAQGAASTALTNDGTGILSWTAAGGGPAAAGTLTGATLASNVLASSLTSVGTLAGVTIGGNALFSPDATYDIGAVSATRPRNVYTSGDVTVAGIRVGRGNNAVATNIAVGTTALNAITTGSRNIGIGYLALRLITTPSFNVAIGAYSMYNVTTGGSNTAMGDGSLANNSTGSNNTALGTGGLSATTAGDNTGLGHNAMAENTTGTFNTAVGAQAGRGTNANTTGSNNTFLGANSVGASSSASNVITLGDSAIATLRCQQTSITSLSDARDKTDIAPIPAGLAFVNALKPVSFVWNMRDGKKVGIPEFGFIAQDLQQVQADHVTVPNLIYDDNPDKLEASAGTLIPVLVKAIQELTAQNTLLAARVAALETI